MLAAMCAVLGAISIDLGNIKITLESVPIILCALMFSPLDAAAVGLVGTFIYQILRYGISVTTALWILPYMVCGLVVGIYAAKRQHKLSLSQTVTIVVIAELIITTLNTGTLYVDSKVYGYYNETLITGMVAIRYAVCIVKAVAVGAVMPTLVKLLQRLITDRRAEARAELRRKNILARKALPESERAKLSAEISGRIAESELYKNAKTVLLYSSVRGEAELVLKGEGKRFAYPVCVSDGIMKAYVPDDASAWRAGSFGIKEPNPEHSTELEPDKIDLVICPCTGFDLELNRMGMGKGYYDRYLPMCVNAHVVAAAYEQQRVESTLPEEWDIPMEAVFTESRVYIK